MQPQFINSIDLIDDGAALRARAEQEGYLFFKKLLPADAVLPVRADMLRVLDTYGWRSKGQDAYGGELDVPALHRVAKETMRLDIGVTHDLYHDIQKLESVHRLPHHIRLLNLYQNLFGSDVLVHPRHIVRMITPHPNMVPTPPHQDFPLIQGTANTWTCWFPVGACPRTRGSLTVLRSSHCLGYLPIQRAEGAGSIAAQLCPSETEWVEGDFEMGDVLTFPSHTVHKALPSQAKNLIRISLDVRYQSAQEPVEKRSLLPHCPLTWEQIYADWKTSDLQYYWRKFPLALSPWDDTLMQPKQRIC